MTNQKKTHNIIKDTPVEKGRINIFVPNSARWADDSSSWLNTGSLP